jgi:hypothetical protein
MQEEENDHVVRKEQVSQDAAYSLYINLSSWEPATVLLGVTTQFPDLVPLGPSCQNFMTSVRPHEEYGSMDPCLKNTRKRFQTNAPCKPGGGALGTLSLFLSFPVLTTEVTETSM